MNEKRMTILYLSQTDVKKTGLTMSKAIELVESAYRMYAAGTVANPPKLPIFLEIFNQPRKAFIAQPAYVGAIDKAGIKWSGLNYDNPLKHGYPSLMQLIILSDGENAMPLAIMQGQWITAMRTGAATAVGTKYLARKEGGNIAIIGAGYQSAFQLEAIDKVIHIGKVFVNDIRREAREKFAEELSTRLGLDVEPVGQIKEAVEKSDTIVLATSAAEPIMKYDWLKKGTLVCAIGVDSQCDFTTIKLVNKIVVDQRKQTMIMGELAKWAARGYVTESDIYGEIGEIVAGKKRGRENAEETILYAPIGMGALDVVTAAWIYERAKEMSIGTSLEYS